MQTLHLSLCCAQTLAELEDSDDESVEDSEVDSDEGEDVDFDEVRLWMVSPRFRSAAGAGAPSWTDAGGLPASGFCRSAACVLSFCR